MRAMALSKGSRILRMQCLIISALQALVFLVSLSQGDAPGQRITAFQASHKARLLYNYREG
jgi:hypothetical protein